MNLLLSVVVLLGLAVHPKIEALKHSFVVNRDARTFIAPIGAPFGFTQGGCFGVDVFDFGLKTYTRRRKSHVPGTRLDQVEAGLVLKRFQSESDFANYHEEIMTNRSRCIFDPFRSIEEEELFDYKDDGFGEVGADTLSVGTDGVYIPLKHRDDTANTSSLMYTFQEGEEGLYFLMYQVCAKNGKPLYTKIRSTFELDFHYRNYDYWGNANYLPAGESQLPHVFLYFSISYGILLCLWACNIKRIQSGVYGGPNERPVVYPDSSAHDGPFDSQDAVCLFRVCPLSLHSTIWSCRAMVRCLLYICLSQGNVSLYRHSADWLWVEFCKAVSERSRKASNFARIDTASFGQYCSRGSITRI